MSAVEQRGGFPVVYGGVVDDTGEVTDDQGTVLPAGDPIRLGQGQIFAELAGRAGPIICKYIEVRNLDATDDVLVFTRQDHSDEDVHLVTLPGGGGQLSVWHGPAELKQIWLKASANAPRFEIVAYSRRG